MATTDRSTRDMVVRKMMIDFTDAKVYWSPGQPEFSQIMNAASASLPELEPFLCKVVNAAREKLSEHDVELARDAALFVGQEGRHSRLHRQFNDTLIKEGYTWLHKLQKELHDHLEDIRVRRGHKFALAYSEAFETFGPLAASFCFDKGRDLFTPWDEPTVYLWLWHMAEEYEHRTVCNYLYRELYDDYFTRIRALYAFCVHFLGWVMRVAFQLIRTDRNSGRLPNTWLSRVREVKALFRLFSFVMPRLVVRGLKPHHDPALLPPPSGVMSLLAAASERYGVADPPQR
ncbi:MULTISPECIES: metal-dependent hydrolase [unclassified Mycobacterium]|uniref:metal-dependent hydrolase n=1 Tax=unclassified Mycobacterium TaxID=2642494 RepID=UPI0007405783|nr:MULTISPECIES: metal-dependent hydrolase [unclassified Mycobacterium]KUH87737.1 hypothetical protein AU185_04650 [Mycobacterium sp. GA-0227b]KUH87784.1 hypothetical protein AU186_03635 [Mycobacterium sp. GA-1999]KUH88676.1 hypothetical protein AU187_06985 [Mycobacterium sp. IS-1556]